MILGVILGGRLGFVLFYQPGCYPANPGQILAVWQGGMSFHGGLLGVAAGVIGFALKNRLPILSVGDAVAAAAPIGLFFGRLANFINAELWGRPSTAPWAVVFPGEAAQACPADWVGPCARHPSQLYEAGLEGLLLFAVLALAIRAGALRRPGRVFGLMLVGYALARLFVERFRQADGQFVTAGQPARPRAAARGGMGADHGAAPVAADAGRGAGAAGAGGAAAAGVRARRAMAVTVRRGGLPTRCGSVKVARARRRRTDAAGGAVHSRRLGPEPVARSQRRGAGADAELRPDMGDLPARAAAAHGPDVGLPEGQMGNSEVGHTNIGAGRVVWMDLPRIDNAIGWQLRQGCIVAADRSSISRLAGAGSHWSVRRTLRDVGKRRRACDSARQPAACTSRSVR